MDQAGNESAALRARIRQQEVVAELGQRALEADELDRFVHEATVAVAETLDNEYAEVLELRPEADELILREGVGWREEAVGTATISNDEGCQAGATLSTAEPVVVEDIESDDRFYAPDLLDSHDVRSGISVVVGPVDDPWGLLGTHSSEPQAVSEADANFLENVANVLASAVENAAATEELELFRALLDHSNDSVLVIDPETAEFLDVNETACRRCGYTHEEFLELTVPDVETELPDLESWRAFVAEIEAGGGQQTFDGCQRRKDGSTYPVEVNASYVELDRPYVLAVARDVTERRRRRRELEQYRTLTQAANDVIVTIDADSVIRSINPTVEDVFGYERAAVLGESLTVLMPDEMESQHRTAIERFLESGERTLDWDYVELPGQHADGSRIQLAVSFNHVEFDGEHFFTGIVRDVTERKAMERELEASNERLEQFAYAASHDLQEPLRMVSSYLQLLESRYGDDLDEDAREFLEFAVDGAERMRSMIDGLLEYSRIDTTDAAVDAVDLEAVLADVRQDLGIRIRESEATITADSLPRVEGDGAQLRQVFQNLLSNAIEYSGDEPPRIHVGAERAGRRWRLTVEDAGIGLDSADTERAFEVFERLGGRDDPEGTGIGLAVCERIVERHGGEIWIDSEPDEGTTVTFTLPAVDGEDD